MPSTTNLIYGNEISGDEKEAKAGGSASKVFRRTREWIRSDLGEGRGKCEDILDFLAHRVLMT